MKGGKKILVVEDNIMNLDLVREVLKTGGFSVVATQSGKDAVELAESEQPDLILMDIQLPGLDGLEVTRKLKSTSTTRHIKVIALTAHAMSGDEEKARRAGCNGYIAKPISTTNFVDVINGYLAPDDAN